MAFNYFMVLKKGLESINLDDYLFFIGLILFIVVYIVSRQTYLSISLFTYFSFTVLSTFIEKVVIRIVIKSQTEKRIFLQFFPHLMNLIVSVSLANAIIQLFW